MFFICLFIELEKVLVEFVRGSGEEFVGGRKSVEWVLFLRNLEEVNDEFMREFFIVGFEVEFFFGRL